jgi:hypothetical protein
MKTDVLLQLRRQLLAFLAELERELVSRGELDITTTELRKCQCKKRQVDSTSDT